MARPGFSKHPKFRRLVHILKEPMPHVRGYLELLWEVSYEAGNPVIGDETDVALACEFPGDASKITNALLTCGAEGGPGFIESAPDQPGRFQIHDLFDHAPRYVKLRQSREFERKNKDLCPIRAHSGAQKRTVCATPAPAPAPAPINTPAAQVCAEPSLATDSAPPISADPPAKAHVAERGTQTDDPPPAVQSSPTVLSFPVKGRNGGLWNLTEAHVSEYVPLYPGIDVLNECRKARQWCFDNPAKQKTQNGIRGFITRWLGRAQDRLGMLGYQQPSYRNDRRAIGLREDN